MTTKAAVTAPPCCGNCSSTVSVHAGRCEPCRKFRYRHGYERPEALIVRAANRHELTPSNNQLKDVTVDVAMTLEAWLRSQLEAVDVPECSEAGCHEQLYAGTLCKRHADEVWYAKRSLPVLAAR